MANYLTTAHALPFFEKEAAERRAAWAEGGRKESRAWALMGSHGFSA